MESASANKSGPAPFQRWHPARYRQRNHLPDPRVWTGRFLAAETVTDSPKERLKQVMASIVALTLPVVGVLSDTAPTEFPRVAQRDGTLPFSQIAHPIFTQEHVSLRAPFPLSTRLRYFSLCSHRVRTLNWPAKRLEKIASLVAHPVGLTGPRTTLFFGFRSPMGEASSPLSLLLRFLEWESPGGQRFRLVKIGKIRYNSVTNSFIERQMACPKRNLAIHCT